MVEALSRAEAGDVLMVETAGGTRAVSGEIFIKEAVRLRLGGVVIDGFVRDLATLRELDVPVFARGATPRAAPSRQSDPQVQLPVRVGGVDVRPGDLVLGDLDGVVVAPPERALAALETAEAIQAKEGAVLAGLDEGFTLLDGLTYREHLARLRAGEESALQFRDPRTG
jgi:regulator of RNase E activity RraA